MYKLVLLVGCGGFVGSVLRFLVSSGMQRLVERPWQPIGTFTVNVAGCFVLGLLGGLVELRQALTPEWRMFAMVGLLGGFTTFSSFGYETLMLMRGGQTWGALANVLGNVVFGLVAAWLGFALATRS